MEKKLSVADLYLELLRERRGGGGGGGARSATDYIHQEYLMKLLSCSLAAV